MTRKLLRITLALAVLCLPASAITVLLLFNPMGLVFLTSFTVRNASGETVHITPIGTVGKAGHRQQLPLVEVPYAYVPSKVTSNFRLAPEEVRRFTYD